MIDFEGTDYLVVKNWLTREECDQLLLYYQTVTGPELSIERLPENIESKIFDVCRQVNQLHNININSIAPPWLDGAFFKSQYTDYPWHQDHETTYLFQNVAEYLNFWVAVKKEDADHDGLSIVPKDLLKQKMNTEQTNFVYNGRGAKMFTPDASNKTTLVDDDTNGTSITLDLDIDDLAVTPSMQTGDLLLICGDTIHKSQESKKGNRIAVSVRCINQDSLISLSWFNNPVLHGLKRFKSHTKGRENLYRHWSKVLHTKEVHTIKEVIKNLKGSLNGNKT